MFRGNLRGLHKSDFEGATRVHLYRPQMRVLGSPLILATLWYTWELDRELAILNDANTSDEQRDRVFRTSNYHGLNALMYALFYERIEEARKLIDSGIDVNELDQPSHTHYTRSALMIAAHRGYEAGVELLLESADLDVNQVNDAGWTALDFACMNGHTRIVRMLLEHRAVSEFSAEIAVHFGRIGALLLLVIHQGGAIELDKFVQTKSLANLPVSKGRFPKTAGMLSLKGYATYLQRPVIVRLLFNCLNRPLCVAARGSVDELLRIYSKADTVSSTRKIVLEAEHATTQRIRRHYLYLQAMHAERDKETQDWWDNLKIRYSATRSKQLIVQMSAPAYDFRIPLDKEITDLENQIADGGKEKSIARMRKELDELKKKRAKLRLGSYENPTVSNSDSDDSDDSDSDSNSDDSASNSSASDSSASDSSESDSSASDDRSQALPDSDSDSELDGVVLMDKDNNVISKRPRLGMPIGCGMCKIDNPQYKCGACNKVRYCTAKCQEKHWAQHQADCFVKPLM